MKVNMNYKKTIFIDLDGVLNQYDGVYDKNTIPPIKEGAKDFLQKLYNSYEIKIFTTRNRMLTAKWLIRNNVDEFISDITNIKEPAFIYIDDRCINFKGDYPKLYDEISEFKVWYK